MIKVYKNGGYGSLYISIRTNNVELYQAIEDLITEYELKELAGERNEL